jgi:hypothetical protein
VIGQPSSYVGTSIMEAPLSDQLPTPTGVERLAFLSERVLKMADVDPSLSGSERASLRMAAQLIAVVRKGRLERVAATN